MVDEGMRESNSSREEGSPTSARGSLTTEQSIVDAGGEIDEELDNEFYIRRMDAGLVMLQMVSVVFAEASAGCGPEVRQCMAHTLKLKGSSIDNVKPVLEGTHSYCLHFASYSNRIRCQCWR